jgi:hypothetical protein
VLLEISVHGSRKSGYNLELTAVYSFWQRRGGASNVLRKANGLLEFEMLKAIKVVVDVFACSMAISHSELSQQIFSSELDFTRESNNDAIENHGSYIGRKHGSENQFDRKLPSN